MNKKSKSNSEIWADCISFCIFVTGFMFFVGVLVLNFNPYPILIDIELDNNTRDVFQSLNYSALERDCPSMEHTVIRCGENHTTVSLEIDYKKCKILTIECARANKHNFEAVNYENR